MSSADSNSININIDNLNTVTDINSLKPASGKIESVGSFDKHSVASYSNGVMGLSNEMESYLTPDEDGSIIKSRKTTLLSFGSELMEIGDVYRFSGRDTLGNEFSTGSQSSITLKNCVFPFAVIREDLTKLSDENLLFDEIDSKTCLLLPDMFSPEELNLFSAAFGDAGRPQIKIFKYDSDLNAMFSGLGIDMSAYSIDASWAKFLVLMRNPEMWKAFEKAARDQQERKEIEFDYGIDHIETIGGMQCTWGSRNGMRLDS